MDRNNSQTSGIDRVTAFVARRSPEITKARHVVDAFGYTIASARTVLSEAYRAGKIDRVKGGSYAADPGRGPTCRRALPINCRIVAVVDLIRGRAPGTTRFIDVQRILGYERSQVSRIIQGAVDNELVVRIGWGLYMPDPRVPIPWLQTAPKRRQRRKKPPRKRAVVLRRGSVEREVRVQDRSTVGQRAVEYIRSRAPVGTRVADLAGLPGVNMSTIKWIVVKLAKAGKIARVARGVYGPIDAAITSIPDLERAHRAPRHRQDDDVPLLDMETGDISDRATDAPAARYPAIAATNRRVDVNFGRGVTLTDIRGLTGISLHTLAARVDVHGLDPVNGDELPSRYCLSAVRMLVAGYQLSLHARTILGDVSAT